MMNDKKHSRNDCRQFLFIILHSVFIIFFASCSVSKKLSKSAKENVLSNKAFQTAHVGISVYDPATNKYLYNYQGDKYFVPASNIKIPTCYAAMKYLGDSLVGLRYYLKDDSIILLPTGDPTFLFSDYKYQPVLNFLKNEKRKLFIDIENWDDDEFGSGWSWNDYNEYYMVERNSFPIFGNVVKISLIGRPVRGKYNIKFEPAFLETQNENFAIRLINSPSRHVIWPDSTPAKFNVRRQKLENQFYLEESNSLLSSQQIPFIVDTVSTTLKILKEDFGLLISNYKKGFQTGSSIDFNSHDLFNYKIHSQPTDSVLKPMMHRSDNFFAEQMLLMVSNEMLGVMNDERIIDTLLKTDFKDLPQRPRWVDGSGLSRYNLFTPQDIVFILNKMNNEFGMDRIKEILPTGGEGTISNYYKTDSGYIYGKTGTLSGVVSFSGFLYTKKGKLLIFSTLVNNHNNSATEIRKAIEKFLQGIRNRY
ncbi:MAG: D-alanyl-D-alanine carboxypeptidase [Calditrichaeota bacterium]|nr:D-alanyl-D-alanine carboxypeptidase [Calditrichota bacterium]